MQTCTAAPSVLPRWSASTFRNEDVFSANYINSISVPSTRGSRSPPTKGIELSVSKKFFLPRAKHE
ncbi:hypothetical protein OROHE_027224 [Orobanche hederae]